MQRLRVTVLVWLLCLSFPVGAASAAFVHMHADAAHDTDHHDGREVHRHGPAGHGHEHEHDSTPDSTSEAGSVVACGPLVPARAPGADSHADLQPLAADLKATRLALAVDGVHDRPHDTDAPTDWPDSRPAALRGPPRA